MKHNKTLFLSLSSEKCYKVSRKKVNFKKNELINHFFKLSKIKVLHFKSKKHGKNSIFFFKNLFEAEKMIRQK